MVTCASCGAACSEHARFCSSCGAPLDVSRETRKIVTVLFCDWVGSTSLGEALDVESLRRVQAAFFAEAREVLERHVGTVEKFIGDAVMAVFGIPEAHEDDALRAARAAVELRQALASLNDRLEQELGVRLSVRTGVNTGEVVAGDPGSGQAFVTGNAIVVAKRLEESAAPGEILIGETTRQLVRDATLLEPSDAAWRLLGVLPDVPGFARHLDAPLVDRERELALLRSSFERATTNGTGYFVTILGPAGVGKSRLVNELLDNVGDEATVLRGRCLAYGEGITFWPLLDVVREAAQIGRDLPATTAKTRIAELVADDPAAPTVAEHVAAAVGLGDTPAPTEETFWAIRRLLESLARRKPLLLSLDDIHWAEETFLDLIEYLGDWTRHVPIVLICLARPELLDARPAWGGGKVNAASVLLDPLTSDESGQLVEQLLGAGEVAAEAKEAIANAAEGNPLFLEEILGMLLDDGRLRREQGTWSIEDLDEIRVPPTIQALLAARLDRLPREERSVVETAAVMGTWFRQSGLAHLSDGEQLEARLGALVRRELIRPAPDPGGDYGFKFRHILIRDAAYRSIPKERRADLHERFATWAEHSYGARVREVEEIVGYHLEQAYRARAELGREDVALGARASAVLASAGRRALNRGDAHAARSLLQRATELPATSVHERVERLLDLATALRETGALAEAKVLLAQATDETRAVGDPRLMARARVAQADLGFFTDPKDWWEDAVVTAERAIPVLAEAADDVGLAEAWILVLLHHYARCRIGEMDEAFIPALVHAQRSGNSHLVSTVRMMMSHAALVGPMPADAAIARCEEIAAESLGNQSFAAVANAVRAYLEAMRGRFEEARSIYRQSQKEFAELGQVRLLAALRSYTGAAELLAGDPVAAERELRAGAEALDAIGDRGNLGSLAPLLARALELQDRTEEAWQYTVLSEELASAYDVYSQVPWRIVRARLEARRGSIEESLRLASEATAIAADTDYLNLEGEARFGLGEVLLAAGERARAEEAFTEAARRFEEKGNVVSFEQAQRARRELAVEA